MGRPGVLLVVGRQRASRGPEEDEITEALIEGSLLRRAGGDMVGSMEGILSGSGHHGMDQRNSDRPPPQRSARRVLSQSACLPACLRCAFGICAECARLRSDHAVLLYRSHGGRGKTGRLETADWARDGDGIRPAIQTRRLMQRRRHGRMLHNLAGCRGGAGGRRLARALTKYPAAGCTAAFIPGREDGEEYGQSCSGIMHVCCAAHRPPPVRNVFPQPSHLASIILIHHSSEPSIRFGEYVVPVHRFSLT
ncbi:hypothetical protein DFH27DRAFT_604317 [Peziza echinospora]|nr:hypothetical protein DFH27DRAFT_604317 [Peziza echinospora]